jgi:hypothetical protein
MAAGSSSTAPAADGDDATDHAAERGIRCPCCPCPGASGVTFKNPSPRIEASVMHQVCSPAILIDALMMRT